MKVLVERHNHEITYKTTCTRCGSELEYFKSDIIYSGDIASSSDKYIICPICKKGISHNDNNGLANSAKNSDN